jgi:hypothetical protein
MKVIEKGRPQIGWAKEYFCTGKGNGGGGCNAKLLVEQPDLFRTSNHDYAGGVDHYITFRCCECGVLTDVDDTPLKPMDLLSKAAWETLKNIKENNLNVVD